jgi:hypothetical protein
VVSLTGTVAQVVKIARNTIPDQRAKRSESRGSRRTYDFDGEHTESNQRLIDPRCGLPHRSGEFPVRWPLWCSILSTVSSVSLHRITNQ